MSAQDKASIGAAPSLGKKIWSSLVLYFGKIPILGPLTRCSAKNHVDSLKEFSITILFGTATFWVTTIFLKALLTNSEKGFYDVFLSTIGTGQLFIFAVGMLGPILLASAEDSDPSKQFPGRTYHLALIVLLGVLASGFYAFVLAAREPKADGLLNTNFLFKSSVAISVVVVIMRYLTTVYRKSTATFNPETGLKQPVNDFADDFNARHPTPEITEQFRDNQSAAADLIARFNKRNGGEA